MVDVVNNNNIVNSSRKEFIDIVTYNSCLELKPLLNISGILDKISGH